MKYKCPNCHAEVDETQSFCSNCGHALSPEKERAGVPWNFRREMGMAAAAYENMLALLRQPIEFFKAFRTEHRYGAAMLYIVVFALSGALFAAIWSLLLGGEAAQVNLQKLLESGGYEMNMQQISGLYKMILGFSVALTPLISLGTAFLWAGAIYLMLSLFRVPERSFLEIFYIVAFAETASIAHVLPMLGGFVAFFGFLAFCIVGLRTRYAVSGGMASLSVLVLPALLVLFFLLIYVAAMTAAG